MANDSIYNLGEYIGKIIDIVSYNMYPKLTSREKDCLIACAIIVNLGESYIYSPKAREIFDLYNFKTKHLIKTWIPKVEAKQWLNLSPNDNLVIAEYLTNINTEGDVCDFKIRLIYETHGSDLG